MQLYEALSMHLTAWREDNYKHDEFPAIAEILEWACQPDVPAFRLRPPQLRFSQKQDLHTPPEIAIRRLISCEFVMI